MTDEELDNEIKRALEQNQKFKMTVITEESKELNATDLKSPLADNTPDKLDEVSEQTKEDVMS